MPHNGPGHERVHLTADERRRFELIEQSLVREDPRLPRDMRAGKGILSWHVVWWALVLIAGWAVTFGLLLVSAPLVMLGTACAAAAAVLRRRKRRQADG